MSNVSTRPSWTAADRIIDDLNLTFEFGDGPCLRLTTSSSVTTHTDFRASCYSDDCGQDNFRPSLTPSLDVNAILRNSIRVSEAVAIPFQNVNTINDSTEDTKSASTESKQSGSRCGTRSFISNMYRRVGNHFSRKDLSVEYSEEDVNRSPQSFSPSKTIRKKYLGHRPDSLSETSLRQLRGDPSIPSELEDLRRTLRQQTSTYQSHHYPGTLLVPEDVASTKQATNYHGEYLRRKREPRNYSERSLPEIPTTPHALEYLQEIDDKLLKFQKKSDSSFATFEYAQHFNAF
ncbi:hypothetical protein V865_005684 [Kwoniella europaea PYCC6329]|uniref:Uncharacterized protein n=1 Tax=Kwoniella europaea PYCC6329 TaxID=1423913 RepID=A0AAX4KQF8_9TREE